MCLFIYYIMGNKLENSTMININHNTIKYGYNFLIKSRIK